ncbi:MAG: carbon-nitrogen family hydrolase [Chthoniobacteraceae bacterium]
MKIHAVQLDTAWENKRANFNRIETLLAQRPPPPGSLVVLPEMFSTGFSMNLAVTCQTRDRGDEKFLSLLARQHHCHVLGGVVSAGENGRGLNQAVAFDPEGNVAARYTKIHPFRRGGETDSHDAGSEIVTFKIEDFVVAPFVCYDLRFPEIFRAAAKKGANLFCVIALWPVSRQQHWLTLLSARAIENQACVVGVNRVGNDPRFSYAGRSVVVNAHGIVVADAGEQEGVLAAEIDAVEVAAWREEFPALSDAHWRDPKS